MTPRKKRYFIIYYETGDDKHHAFIATDSTLADSIEAIVFEGSNARIIGIETVSQTMLPDVRY